MYFSTDEDVIYRLAAWLREHPTELYRLLKLLKAPRCEGPDCDRLDVSEAPCMTAYTWDGEGEDPNKPPVLCPQCEQEYIEVWESMWSEYYGGLL